jgi:hypothetical protein
MTHTNYNNDMQCKRNKWLNSILNKDNKELKMGQPFSVHLTWDWLEENERMIRNPSYSLKAY